MTWHQAKNVSVLREQQNICPSFVSLQFQMFPPTQSSRELFNLFYSHFHFLTCALFVKLRYSFTLLNDSYYWKKDTFIKVLFWYFVTSSRLYFSDETIFGPYTKLLFLCNSPFEETVQVHATQNNACRFVWDNNLICQTVSVWQQRLPAAGLEEQDALLMSGTSDLVPPSKQHQSNPIRSKQVM